MSQLQSYITKYGAVAGPKLYHAIRSRSAYMGANARRRATIARLTDQAVPTRRSAAGSGRSGQTVLLPFDRDDDRSAPVGG